MLAAGLRNAAISYTVLYIALRTWYFVQILKYSMHAYNFFLI
jgi:hypothetical protein